MKPGATVIDVGINRTADGLAGDVDFDAVAEVAGAITPVPGGVGPMTIACLLRNTLRPPARRRRARGVTRSRRAALRGGRRWRVALLARLARTGSSSRPVGGHGRLVGPLGWPDVVVLLPVAALLALWLVVATVGAGVAAAVAAGVVTADPGRAGVFLVLLVRVLDLGDGAPRPARRSPPGSACSPR